MKNLVEPIRNVKDIEKILNFLKTDLRYYLIFLLGIYSGLRVSDILALDVSDVKDKEYIEVLELKTNKFKKFPINKKIKTVIKEYLKNVRSKMYAIKDKDALFIGKKHCRLERSQVWRKINEACKKCNIDGNYGTHTMRKTFGYHHYRKFKDIALLQQLFNHSSPVITLRYIGIFQDEINQAYKNFDYFEPENQVEKVEEIGIKTFLKNYLNNGGTKHKEFAELALSYI